MAVKFKLSDEEKEKAGKLLKAMAEDKKELSSISSEKEQHSVSQNISLPMASSRSNLKIPSYRQNYSNTKLSLPKARLSNVDINDLNLVTRKDIEAMEESEQINKDIAKGDYNSSISHVLNSFPEGIKSGIAGIANAGLIPLATTLQRYSDVGQRVGVLGKENIFNNASNSLLDASDYLTDNSSYRNKVGSNIDNNIVKTAGDVSFNVGQMMPSVASNLIVPGSGLAVTGISAGGNSAQETINNDRSNLMQSTLTGVAKGLVEAGTEKLTGGNIISKTGSLDNVVNKAISSKIKSNIGKEIANKGYQFVGEMAEEQISNNAGYVIDKLINNKDLPDAEQWWNDFSETNKVTFLTTLALNMIGLGGGSFSDNVDTTKYTSQELQEADKWLNEAKKIIEQENEIQNNNQLPTARNNQQLNESTLPVQNEQYRYNNRNYEESAKRYGIDTNNETVKSINRVAQNRGINVTYNADLFNDANTNAIWRNNSDGTREIILNPNADTNKTLQNVITHELTHDLEGTTEYNELRDLILNYNENKTDYAEARKSLEELYSKVYDRNSTEFETLVNNEVVADILGNKLGNQEFVNNLTTQKPNLGKKIYNWVVDKLNKLNKLTGYKSEKLFWTDVKNKFENTYKQDYKGNSNSTVSKFSINSNFKQEYDNWNKVDRQGNFLIGRTSEALKSIGLDDYDIVMDKSKILKIKNDHPEMNDDIIKSIPEILENPTLILNSQSNNKKAQARKVIFGEILDTRGNPVLVALELNPFENKNNIDKIYKVASAYGKEKLATIQKWINNEENILYIDKQKNRTINWLSGLGLQLPVPNNLSSSINSITPQNEDVNTKYSMQESKNNSWQSYLDKNYKSTGTGQTIQEVKKAPIVNDNTLATGKYTQEQEIQKRKTLNPTEISNLKQENASTTPRLKNKNYERGNKKSNFFSNITEKSKFLNEDFRNVMKQDENIEYYKTVSNKETLEKAYNKLQEDGETEVVKWHSKDSEKATTEDVAEGWILLKQYQDSGDYESAVEVAKKMREIGTKAGQTVQAYNILSRLTPEGMFYYAQSELSEAYSKMVEGKSKKWIDENKSKFDLTPQETKFIIDTMQEVSTMPDGYNKKVKLAEIQKVITDKIPATAGQSIKAWMRISMLFNPKTQVRNVMGNTVIVPVNMFSDSVSAGIDKLISKKTGIRTTGNTSIKNYAKGFGKGLYESYNDLKKGINTRNIQGNRFEVSEGRSFNNKGLGKALNRVDNLLSFMLDAGDRGFYEATFTNSINNQLVLNNTTEVTQEMIDIATTEALQRTWQDNNNYTKAVLKIRNILNSANIKGYGLGDVLIPFAKTPANLTKAIIDYSPAGLVNTITSGIKLKNSLENGQYTPQLQHQFAQNLGKATAGTFLYVLGYALASAGIATGEADEDKDVKNFMKNSLGINSYSIKIGDKSFAYDWAQPIATPLAIMTNFVKYSKENPEASTLDKAINAMNIGTEQLLSQSFMDSLNTVLNGNGATLENLSQAVLELPSRAIPTFSKQIADMVDSTQRTSFVYDKPIQSAINSVIAKIPGTSKQLPASVDTLGNEIQKYGGENNLFNVFLNPANMNKGQLSKAGEEIYNVYKETGDTTIFPRTAPYYINNKGEKITMTSEERSNFQKISGTYVEDTLEGMLKNDCYKKLGNEEKAELINQIVSDSYSKAKYDVLKIDSEEYEKLRETLKSIKTTTYYDYKSKTKDMKTNKEKIEVLVDSKYPNKEITTLYENYILSDNDTEYPIIKETFTNNGLNINKYLKYKTQEFTSDKNDDGTLSGKTVSGSKKEKVYQYVNNMDITYTQKLLLLSMEYTLNDNEQKILANYINSLDVSSEEKLNSYNKLKGFTVYKDGTIEW